jgi:protein-S-isoprenylcysteine O-methyltransferase Ste14
MLFADEWLAAFLVAYFTLWIFSLFFLRAWIVWRRTGVFPVIVERGNTPHGFLARYLFVLCSLESVAIVFFAFFREKYFLLLSFSFMEYSILRLIGIGLMIPSLLLMFKAQAEMGVSWRVGIDRAHKTELVAKGLFRFSRNPIYLGLLATVLGLFLVLPNLVTFLVLTQGWLGLQLEIRLEEEFLRVQHGQSYLDYCKRVRRWI